MIQKAHAAFNYELRDCDFLLSVLLKLAISKKKLYNQIFSVCACVISSLVWDFIFSLSSPPCEAYLISLRFIFYFMVCSIFFLIFFPLLLCKLPLAFNLFVTWLTEAKKTTKTSKHVSHFSANELCKRNRHRIT